MIAVIHDIVLFIICVVGLPLGGLFVLCLIGAIDQRINGEYTCDDPSTGL